MGAFDHFTESSSKLKNESLSIDHKKGRIKASFAAVKFLDKDTKQSVIFVPSLDVSGYGESYEKATEILEFNLSELFAHLCRLSAQDALSELYSLGWKRSAFFNKQFSKAYVDANGQLQNLNADKATIEHITLEAA